MPTDDFDTNVSDGEAALLAATKTLVEVLISAEIVPASVLDQMLTDQRNTFFAKRMPKAVTMIEELRAFATDPQREADRSELQQLLREQPKGSG